MSLIFNVGILVSINERNNTDKTKQKTKNENAIKTYDGTEMYTKNYIYNISDDVFSYCVKCLTGDQRRRGTEIIIHL